MADASAMAERCSSQTLWMGSTSQIAGLREQLPKIEKTLVVGARTATCFWSSCKDQRWSDCRVARTFPVLVGGSKHEKVVEVDTPYSFGTQTES